MTLSRFLIISAISTVGFATASNAAIMEFDTTGTTGAFGGGDTSLAATALDAGLEASSLVFAGLLTGNDTAGSFSTHGWGTTASASFAAGQYLSWTVDATAGNAVNLSEVTFEYNAQQGDDVDWALFSSETGFASFGDAIDSGTVLGAEVPFGNSTAHQVVDLSGITSLQGVADSIEFRLVLANASSAFSRTGVRTTGSNPGLTVDGTIVVIPEPASIALIGLGSLLLSGRRRKA